MTRFLLALLFLSASAAHAKPPNILFIFTDDHAAHAISAYGSKINRTPNIDRIAKEGMLFENCFCGNSICGPSRATILTGKHSHLNGFFRNGNVFDGEQQTFPKLLQQAGYQTAMIGKWHLASSPTGFDYWKVLPGQGRYYNPDFRTPEGTERIEGYCTDIITDVALDWLKEGRDGEKPFCLMYQHKAPHREWSPGPDHLTMFDDVTLPEPPTLFDDYEGRTSAAKAQEMEIGRHMYIGYDLKVPPLESDPPQEHRMWGYVYDRMTPAQKKVWDAAYGPKNKAYREAKLTGKDDVRWKYQRYVKDYLRCIASVDDNIGRVLKHLDDTGLAKDTIVIYSSDQGFYLGDHGWYDKRWMYEESYRMPFVIRWPGVIEPGQRNEKLVSNIDFAATFLDMAGLETPADMQGTSMVPLMKGQDPAYWRDSLYYHYYEMPGPHMVARHYGIRTETHKLIRYPDIDEWELFDLEKDPDELRSVHAEADYAELRQNLEQELKWLQAKYAVDNPDAPNRVLDMKFLSKRMSKVPFEIALALDEADDVVRRDLDPGRKPITVGGRVNGASDGVLIAQGGEGLGYVLYLEKGVPHFGTRSNGKLVVVKGGEAVPQGKPSLVVGRVDVRGEQQVLIDGKVVGSAPGQFVMRKPSDALTLGRDASSRVGEYKDEYRLNGTLKDVRIYFGKMTEEQLQTWLAKVP